MSEEELNILYDVLYSESSWYVYDYQGFDYETIFPIIEKLIKINKEQEDKINKAIELLKTLDEDTLSNMQLSLEIIGHIEYILKGGNNG